MSRRRGPGATNRLIFLRNKRGSNAPLAFKTAGTRLLLPPKTSRLCWRMLLEELGARPSVRRFYRPCRTGVCLSQHSHRYLASPATMYDNYIALGDNPLHLDTFARKFRCHPFELGDESGLVAFNMRMLNIIIANIARDSLARQAVVKHHFVESNDIWPCSDRYLLSHAHSSSGWLYRYSSAPRYWEPVLSSRLRFAVPE